MSLTSPLLPWIHKQHLLQIQDVRTFVQQVLNMSEPKGGVIQSATKLIVVHVTERRRFDAIRMPSQQRADVVPNVRRNRGSAARHTSLKSIGSVGNMFW